MEQIQPMKKVKMKNRPGFETRCMRWVYRILYPYFHCRVTMTEELTESTEPVVFIANHYDIFGPPSFVLSMPFVASIWINEELISEESALENLTPTLRRLFPFLSRRMQDWLCRKAAWLSCHVLTRFGAIPVDRNRPSKLVSTMRQSILALEEGRNLLIFPEIGLPEYSLTSVTPFFPGFAMLGHLYYRKTGKNLRFCPCYIDEQHHRIRTGEMTVCNPDAPDVTAEAERVSGELNEKIREMAAESRGLEKEKERENSSPVRRTILFFCNLLRFLLLIPLLTMLGLPNPPLILVFYLISQGLRITFNAVASMTYLSSNRFSSLLSRGIGVVTDISVLAYLTAVNPRMNWLLYTLILNAAVFLISNIRSAVLWQRCAGINYFDTLSANLVLVVCLQQLLAIRLNGLVLGVIVMAAMIFLAFSAGFCVAFNLRIDREEQQRT